MDSMYGSHTMCRVLDVSHARLYSANSRFRADPAISGERREFRGHNWIGACADCSPRGVRGSCFAAVLAS